MSYRKVLGSILVVNTREAGNERDDSTTVISLDLTIKSYLPCISNESCFDLLVLVVTDMYADELDHFHLFNTYIFNTAEPCVQKKYV